MPYKPVPPRSIPPLADAVAAAFDALPAAVGVALAGSRTGPLADDRSDIDLYVYARERIPAQSRLAIMHRFTDHGGIDERFWEPGDEWSDAHTRQGLDIIFRTPRGIEERWTACL
jgi:predicted nucleotidyltransferase